MGWQIHLWKKVCGIKYHISILAVKEQEEIYPLPRPEYIFRGSETLIIMGHYKDVRALAKAR